jgi:hypothetical protein
MEPSRKDELSPISDDEFMLRQIHKNHYHAGKNKPVQTNHFQPHEDDDDGLSVYRERFISVDELARAGRKPGEYYIARFRASELKLPGNNLTLDPKPNKDPSQPRGHSVIPQLSISAYKADEKKGKQICFELAKLAGQRIVLVPAGCER